MPHELPKTYEPGAIEARWAEYWVREKLFHVETPPRSATEGPQGLKPAQSEAAAGSAKAEPHPKPSSEADSGGSVI